MDLPLGSLGGFDSRYGNAGNFRVPLHLWSLLPRFALTFR
jgi:hypothetical protein